MARRDRDNRQNARDQLDAYKKEIGKQYMDGLLSDREYEKLLRDKEAELKLKAPASPNGDRQAECPSCGALVGGYDTVCGICGSTLVPVLSVEGEKVQTEKAPSERGGDIPENWRELWLDKKFRSMSPEELMKQPPDVLKGVSAGDSAKMKAAFNIKTLEDFATAKYLSWAQELAALKANPGAYRKRAFKHRLVKEYEEKSLDEILRAPTYALQGVSQGDADKLTDAFNTKTVEELGNLNFISWANRIYDMAHAPHIFKVGDRVRLPSGQKGTVIFATEPDAKGNQKIDVEVA